MFDTINGSQKKSKKKFIKKINGIEYLCFPNNSPETFNKNFQIYYVILLMIVLKLFNI